jgi:M6 family metalloprotease-like protein
MRRFSILLLLALPALSVLVGEMAPSLQGLVPGVAAGPLSAQDVEMLGEHYGTRPPDGYFRELARDPEAFRFQREGMDRLIHMQRLRGAPLPSLLLEGGPARSLGPRDIPMLGEFRFPLVLGLFADSEEPTFDRDRIQREYFDGPNSYHQTVTELYHEMSSGRVQLDGATFPWVRTELSAEEVTLGNNGLVSSRDLGVGAFIEQIVAALDAMGVDWSRFDNTGDGFVDVLSVLHPTHGAECGGGGDRVWSHRWNVRNATQGRVNPGIRTSTPRPDGDGYIHINDYTIQPVMACNAEDINQIGIFAHELGHGFGLPDLYGTGGSGIRGTGRWDLMGTGAWGCRGDDPARPCHMGAWSKAVLGWVDVEDVEPDRSHGTITLPPVQDAARVLRVGAGRGGDEFLLLENRQRIGSDQDLWEPGLLIWHVDPAVLEVGWPVNRVNANPDHLGVWLRQADGRNALATGGASHADPGHPFPGCIKDDYEDYFDPSIPCQRRNREFHAGTTPSAETHGFGPFGVTVTGIELVGAEPHDVRFHLTTRWSRVTLAREGESDVTGGAPFLVDGEPNSGDPAVISAAPFQSLILEAPPGEELEEGVRIGFAGWSDGAPRVREFQAPLGDTTLTARYGGEEVQVRWTASADGGNLEPGHLETDPASPDLWFARGSEVRFEARARTGFTFVQWSGALTGGENPATLTLDDPVDVSADFQFIFAVEGLPGEVALPAAEPVEIGLEVTSGEDPFMWYLVEGSLPDGMEFRGGEARITGVPMEMGRFPIHLRVHDAQGLEAAAAVVLEVGVPSVGVDDLMSGFLGRGIALTHAQREFLDREGNRNGRYDVGDARRFVLAHPDLPRTVPSGPEAAAGRIAAGNGTEIILRVSFPEAPDSSGPAAGGRRR